MNREVWKIDYFSESEPTDWICSKCFSGSLFPKAKPVINRNDKFTVHLKCSYSRCYEEYACLGKVKYFSSLTRYEVSKIYEGPKYKRFYPLHFSSTLRLFSLNHIIPQSVTACIDESFDDFWSDICSSANALRRALEKLFDELDVPEEKNLHQRIENYKSSSLAKLFSAIKSIGNSGSHGDNLTRKDLLDVYVIFEHCLEELFPTGDKRSAFKLADEINSRKGGRFKC